MVILGYPYTPLLFLSAKRYACFYKVPAGMRHTLGSFLSFSNTPAFNIGNALTTLTTIIAYPMVPVDGIPSCSYFIVRLLEGYSTSTTLMTSQKDARFSDERSSLTLIPQRLATVPPMLWNLPPNTMVTLASPTHRNTNAEIVSSSPSWTHSPAHYLPHKTTLANYVWQTPLLTGSNLP
jgi:hypothetical protein